ncbi:MAG: 3,5-nucleoside bisphosphate phosphatase [Fusobacteriaceae bacterium]|jgi:predicted metal-dependent phosphoesterase TrpH|nr:3,5-nucleoside bisphosphate phosphatase [Fusobacteriaceae bacterium]
MIDLHIHTTASDGTLSPKELIEYAKQKNLSVIAITDHDSISSLDEAISEGKKKNIIVIPGIEFSTEYNYKEVHILGYFIDYKNKELLNTIKSLKNERINRTYKIIEKLKQNGINISIEDIEKEAKGDVISRMHISNVLLNKKYVSTKAEAFEKYLGIGKLAYVERELTPLKAIEVIKKSGGLAVLAHPKLIDLENEKEFISLLAKNNLDGIETYYPGFSSSDIDRYINFCNIYNLIPTGGSDFHGHNRLTSDLNMLKLPQKIYLNMLNRLNI